MGFNQKKIKGKLIRICTIFTGDLGNFCETIQI